MAGSRFSRFAGWQTLLLSVLLVVSGGFPPSGRSQNHSRQIVVHAKRFAFTPAEITVKKGQTTRLVLISDDVTHGLTVEGLSINAEIRKGRKTIVPVTPTQTGDFPGSCSIFCGSGHRDMEFVIHVVE
jgi:cytochrome c oxidase subunit 2